ncbi:MAG: 50S ribosomal protein L29 [Candidatus Dadabacteria bacterium]|nr:50S ribosomal protein L29 [Candidatus Dadabacteria bacterium]NIQ15161.1 50S ribosomal protein L29 [Candidatus Dadabacteria bacterium]
MARADELRDLTDDELAKKERDAKEELFNIKIQVATQQNTNFARIKQLKKDIARILTIKKEKELSSGS